MILADYLALLSRLDGDPIRMVWHRNPASATNEWSIQVGSCAEFDRLAATIPVPADKRWLNGDRRQHGNLLILREHHGEDGYIVHICHGCEPADTGQEVLL